MSGKYNLFTQASVLDNPLSERVRKLEDLVERVSNKVEQLDRVVFGLERENAQLKDDLLKARSDILDLRSASFNQQRVGAPLSIVEAADERRIVPRIPTLLAPSNLVNVRNVVPEAEVKHELIDRSRFASDALIVYDGNESSNSNSTRTISEPRSDKKANSIYKVKARYDGMSDYKIKSIVMSQLPENTSPNPIAALMNYSSHVLGCDVSFKHVDDREHNIHVIEVSIDGRLLGRAEDRKKSSARELACLQAIRQLNSNSMLVDELAISMLTKLEKI